MIVTIARECGCFGNEIGTLLAQELGVPLYDKEKITSLAREKGIYEKYTNFFEEKQENLLFSAIAEEEQLDEVRRTPRCALHEVVGDNSCVIIGRCSNIILKDELNAKNIFVYASDMDFKIKRKVDSILDFKFDDFELVGYDPYPKIEGKVSV